MIDYEDILKNMLHDVITDINGAMEQYSYVLEPEAYWKTLFSTIKAHRETFYTLIKAGFGYIILEEITKHMTYGIDEKDIKSRYDMIFWSGAVYNVLMNWIQYDTKQTEDEMVQICLYIMENFNK